MKHNRRTYGILLSIICMLLASSCAMAPLEVFMSPNPSFDNSGVSGAPQGQPQPQIGITVAGTQPTTTASAGDDITILVYQLEEALAEANAHALAGEARLDEHNVLEAIREFELARQLVEQNIEPGLLYIQQVPKVQGGANILSDYRLQSMDIQRQAVLDRIKTSYDFETLYQRKFNQERVNALRQQNRPVFQPLAFDPSPAPGPSPQQSARPVELESTDGYVIIDTMPLVVPVDDVQWHIERFQQHRTTFYSYLLRARQYYPVVSSILASHGVPEQLAYVGLVASGYQPAVRDAASGKVGLWQLSAEVARRYGLRVNSNTDERKDIEASTTAFARYVRDLERRFGSWDLAVMAYEMGEQKLQRAINRAGMYDANEVRRYVGTTSPEGAFLPKLAAAILIAKEPETFGFVSATASRTSAQSGAGELVPVNMEWREPPITTILNQ